VRRLGERKYGRTDADTYADNVAFAHANTRTCRHSFNVGRERYCADGRNFSISTLADGTKANREQ
jgi:hypothetical protein